MQLRFYVLVTTSAYLQCLK